ncbi:MAG TPA: HAD family hydrolase [Steroidobacteraceae bacterium]|jgi:HAD superfamily hydrolase (TIGR01509 family)
MPFELLILDCDGVLVDTERISHQVIVDLLAEANVSMSFDAAFERFLGKSTAQCIPLVAALLGADVSEQFMRDYRQRTRLAFQTELRAIPGIEAALDAIRLPYCVASSGELEKMRTTLGLTGLLPRFEGKLTSVTEVAHPKPAPDVYLLAASKFGVAPERCIVVEDSPTGVAAGVAAGMTVFGYSGLTAGAQLLDAGAHRVFNAMSLLPGMIDGRC